METIPKASCRKIGFVRKIHGVNGELVLEFEPCFEFSVVKAKRFFVEITGLLVPFFVSGDGIRLRSDKTAFINFEWVEDEKYARRVAGKDVYLFKSEIIGEPVTRPEFAFAGYFLKDGKSGETGIITHVDNFSDNIVFTVILKGKEIMVPFNEDLVILVDHKDKKITLNLPEGLMK